MKKMYDPVKYFGLTFLLTWGCWIPAAALSKRPGAGAMGEDVMSLMAIGLFGPLFAALILVFARRGAEGKALRRDVLGKLTCLRGIRPARAAFMVLVMPAVIVAAVLLSLAFGQGLEQLQLSPEFSIVEGSVAMSWVVAFLAPALEELGWSSYGIDSLRGRGRLLSAILLFGVLWSLWHLPLIFIDGYYHAGLLAESPAYAVNFFVSVVPLTVITNWLYYRNGRSILSAIVFHAIVNVCSEAFCVTNFTKCLVTAVLAAVAVCVVCRDRRFFLSRTEGQGPSAGSLGRAG
ncbi:MAG: CPBP family intramembrane metalloprotease [Clostridiales Family XIII bacterium]|jgi:membrane protease YdiL (CAAX protease family)|nr:CPBP family intramembrane metalloprotease [Clostridiales Family XIII bacterium]